jgi:guanine deaminase
MNDKRILFMQRAIELSRQGMEQLDGGPFGCVIVKDGVIVGEGNNRVTSTNDPTAHAEVVAIREACKNLNTFQLDGCEIYTSCEPCPMCLGAIYWARPDQIFYANTRADAAAIGFDDSMIYDEISSNPDARKIPMVQLSNDAAREVFEQWRNKSDKTVY